jgi:hypothetical protein
MSKEEEACLMAVLGEVRKWQAGGRFGYSLPVIRGELLERLEKLSDKVTRDKCTRCSGKGEHENMRCVACEPLHPSNMDY